MMRNYTYYYVYGLSVKYQPALYGQQGGNTKAIRRVEQASYASNTEGSPADNDLRNARGYHTLTPNTPFKRFFRCGKYLKRMKQGWVKEGFEIDDEDKLRTSIKVWGENLGAEGTTDLG